MRGRKQSGWLPATSVTLVVLAACGGGSGGDPERGDAGHPTDATGDKEAPRDAGSDDNSSAPGTPDGSVDAGVGADGGVRSHDASLDARREASGRDSGGDASSGHEAGGDVEGGVEAGGDAGCVPLTCTQAEAMGEVTGCAALDLGCGAKQSCAPCTGGTACKANRCVTCYELTLGGLPAWPSVLADAVGDVNGDGLADVVGVGTFQYDVEVSLATCAGAFERPVVIFSVPRYYGGSMALVDVDGDHILDLEVAGTTTLYVSRGRGDGTFAPPTTYATPDVRPPLFVQDVNGDGFADVAFDAKGLGLYVLRNDGTGRFDALPLVPLPSGVATLAIEDLDGDGYPDAFVGTYTSTPSLSWMKGQGDGTFGPATPLTTPKDGWSVADVNGDHRADLLVPKGGQTLVKIGDGAGGFTTTGSIQGFARIVGDMNGDGHVDAVTTLAGTSLALGHGDGTFAAPTFVSSLFGPALAADVDGDGHPDLMLQDSYANYFSYEVVVASMPVILANGDGTFRAPPSEAPGGTPRSLASGDLDEDGHVDLVIGEVDMKSILLQLGRGNGTFGPPLTVVTGVAPEDLVVRDFDGDGHQDVAAVAGDAIVVFPGAGDGSFGAPRRTALNLIGGSALPRLTVADFDGDGLDDLAAMEVGEGFDDTARVFLNDWTGRFHQAGSARAHANIESITAGDVNGDGFVDVVVGSTSCYHCIASAAIQVFIGHGDGSLSPRVVTPNGDNYYLSAVAAADFDGDGRLDVAVGGNGLVTVRRGAGDGTFEAPVLYPITADAYGVTVVDLDGDGFADLLTTDAYGPSVGFLRGHGDGTFERGRVFGAGRNVHRSTAADFNEDGRLDVAVTNLASHDVSILLGGHP